MKCPFKVSDSSMSAYQSKKYFEDCDGEKCMAYNKELNICNLCSDKRTFNIETK